MKKSVKRKSVKIVLSNRWLYTLIAVGILIILGVGVYAYTSTNGVGHEYTEIKPCSNGQILKVSGGVWACGTDVDTDTDTRGSLSCFLVDTPAKYTSCDTTCLNNGGACVNDNGAGTKCIGFGNYILTCRCCKVV